jgi:hypothetical protein
VRSFETSASNSECQKKSAAEYLRALGLRPLMENNSVESGVSEPQKARDSRVSAIECKSDGEAVWLAVRSWPTADVAAYCKHPR